MLKRTLIFVLFLCFHNSLCKGDFIIEVRDGQMTPGGLGFVDVLLRSQSDTAVNGFSLLFEISTSPSGGVLEFQDSFSSMSTPQQSDSERTFSSMDYSYIFLGKVQLGDFSATRTAGNNRRLTASDFATEDVPITAGTNYLLARMELQHIAPMSESGPTNYSISLVNDPINNGILNTGAFDVNYSLSTSGTVTVTAVPEPACFTSIGILVYALFGSSRRRRR